jgi:hypothetical protein
MPRTATLSTIFTLYVVWPSRDLTVSIGPSTPSTVPRTRTVGDCCWPKGRGCGKQQGKASRAESAPCHLVHRDPPELGLEKWLSLNAEYARIWPNITVKKAPPPDSKEWEGKPDKLQYFSPNPGAGD